MLQKSVITILRVTAKRSRLVIEGEMDYNGLRVPFNYRASLGVKGKVRYLRYAYIIFLVWYGFSTFTDTSSGHPSTRGLHCMWW